MSTEPKFTKGPWTVFIDDTGGRWTGWPISIGAAHDEDKSVVRPGGQYPYEWDAAMSQREAVANAHLIAAAPELYEALKAALPHLHELDSQHQRIVETHGNQYSGLVAVTLVESALSKAEGRS